jgi:hypothetical protein
MSSVVVVWHPEGADPEPCLQELGLQTQLPDRIVTLATPCYPSAEQLRLLLGPTPPDLVSLLSADCVPPSDWLERGARLLERWPDARASGGGIVDAQHTLAGRFASHYYARDWGEIRRENVPYLFAEACHVRGACLLERWMGCAVAGPGLLFDPRLGVTSTLPQTLPGLLDRVRQRAALLRRGLPARSAFRWGLQWGAGTARWLVRDCLFRLGMPGLPGWWLRPGFLLAEVAAAWRADRCKA